MSSDGRVVRATEGPEGPVGTEEGAEEEEEAAVPFCRGNVAADELVGAAAARPKNSAPGARADQADSNLIMWVCVKM